MPHSLIILRTRYWWVWFHCPLLEANMYWRKPVRCVIGVCCPELGGVRPRRFKCTASMGKSIGGMSSVRCIEVVRFSEGPLLEVSLYIYIYPPSEVDERTALIMLAIHLFIFVSVLVLHWTTSGWYNARCAHRYTHITSSKHVYNM